MTKTKLISIASVLSTTALLPGLALGVDAGGVNIGIQPRLEAGVMNYKYESGSVSSTQLSTATTFGSNFTQQRYKYKDTMPTLGGGLTFSVDRFYIDLSGQKAFNGNDNNSFRYSSFTEGSEGSLYFSGDPNYKADFDRQEYAASLGYGITNELSIFGGYKWAKTDFNTKGNGPLGALLVPGDIFLSGDNFDGYMQTKVNYDFKYHGPFIGLAYGLNDIKQGFLEGNLKFTFAAAYLDGKVHVKSESKNFVVTSVDGVAINPTPLSNEVASFGASAGTFDSEGNTIGLTFGLSWVGTTPVEGLGYLLGFNAYSYRFHANKSSNPDINETVYQFKAGISYRF